MTEASHQQALPKTLEEILIEEYAAIGVLGEILGPTGISNLRSKRLINASAKKVDRHIAQNSAIYREMLLERKGISDPAKLSSDDEKQILAAAELDTLFQLEETRPANLTREQILDEAPELVRKKAKRLAQRGFDGISGGEAELSPTSVEGRLERLKDPAMGLPSALCFSGGGIRSATFCLGIMQALAKHGLLKKFHYLSTVSGGGYIGSWLSAWIARSKDPDPVMDVEAQLAGGARDGVVEPPEITHLRSYGNYLSPRLGLFSPDTWILITVFVRNLLLVWTYLLPILAATLFLPKIIVQLVEIKPSTSFHTFAGLFAIAAGIFGFANVVSMRPFLGTFFRTPRWSTTAVWVAVRCISPLILMACGLTYWWYWFRVPEYHSAIRIPAWLGDSLFVSLFAAGVVFFAVGYGSSLLLKMAAHVFRIEAEAEGKYRDRTGWSFLLKEIVLGAFVPGALFGVGLYLVSNGLELVLDSVGSAFATRLVLVAGVPSILVVFALSATVGVGLASKLSDDMDREWLARAGAYSSVFVIGWMLVTAVVLFGYDGLKSILESNWNVSKTILAAVGGTSGLITLVFGFVGSSSANDQPEKSGKAAFAMWFAPQVAAPVFVVYLLILVSASTDWVLMKTAGVYYPYFGLNGIFSSVYQIPVSFNFWAVILLVLLASFFGWRININKFSFHAIYRERLIRAYLGASRIAARRDTANPFTDLDNDDNIRMNELIKGKPLHVVNMSLNITGSKVMKWRNRKAESFTATSLNCGSSTMNQGAGVFRPSEEYGFNEQVKRSITLGTAAAISGAAVNPSMGYYTSSKAVIALMAFFNVRLGWWLGNPGLVKSFSQRLIGSSRFTEFWKRASPRFAPVPLIYEAFGKLGNGSPYVNLSDGGHFENLGLYEMIVRRCRFVVVCDAGADKGGYFSDLGNAIHKIRVDQGVPIVFRQKLEPHRDRTCAVAEIKYSVADGTPESYNGVLIYIKPTITGDEPFDIFNYHKENQDFPHESTADQMYSETQFESYRLLGEEMMSKILSEGGEAKTKCADFKEITERAQNLIAMQTKRSREKDGSN